RRLEGQFLRPYRMAVALALAGMLLQSVLLLPIPLLQGWVLDQLVALFGASAAPQGPDASAVTRLILVALAASVACYLARMALAWKVAEVMTRASLEVVRQVSDSLHRKV